MEQAATLPDSWLPLGPHTGQGRRSCGQLQWQCRIKVTTTQSHRPIAVPPSLRPLSFIQPGRACLRSPSRYPARPAPGQPHGGHPARAPDAPAVGMAARALGPPSGRSCPLAVSAPGSAGSAASCSPSAHPQRVRARRGPVMPAHPGQDHVAGVEAQGPGQRRHLAAPGRHQDDRDLQDAARQPPEGGQLLPDPRQIRCTRGRGCPMNAAVPRRGRSCGLPRLSCLRPGLRLPFEREECTEPDRDEVRQDDPGSHT